MNARWGWVAVLSLVGIGVVSLRRAPTPAIDISADRTSVAPSQTPSDEAAPTPGAIALPLRSEESRSRQRVVPPGPPPPPDYVEPWTGVDLEPVIVAARRSHTVDRTDPWDPNVLHPVTPPHVPRPDDSDPWTAAVSASRDLPRTEPKRAPTLDPESPWGEPAAPAKTYSL